MKRHDCLERDIYEGIIEGKKGRGRPRRRWSKEVIGAVGYVRKKIYCTEDANISITTLAEKYATVV